MNTDFCLTISQAEFGFIWGLLNEKPSGQSRLLMNKMESQVGGQIHAYEESQRAVERELSAKATAERDAAIAAAAATLLNERAAVAALGKDFVQPGSAPAPTTSPAPLSVITGAVLEPLTNPTPGA